CGVDLTDPAFHVNGTVASVLEGERIFIASGLGAFVGEHFSRGKLLWTAGANAGGAAEVKRHGLSGATHTFERWLPQGAVIAVGDAFTVTAGCEKQFATCAAKFSNQLRFRGFPMMPGNDWAISRPSAGEPMDGGSRYK